MRNAPRLRVLHVEDDDSTAAVIRVHLEADGLAVTRVADVVAGLAALRRESFDVVAVDHGLPGPSGLEMVRRLADTADAPPVVMITANDDATTAVGAMRLGAQDYVVKDTRATFLELLPLVLRRAVNERRMEEERGRLLDELIRSQNELHAANQELQRRLEIDGLTGLANRRALDRWLGEALARSAAEEKPISVLLCDVDHFKRYNDSLGHLAGDDCLRQIAEALSSATEGVDDLVARYGGDEFVLVLANAENERAWEVADRALLAVRELELAGRGDLAIGLSIGIATLRPKPGHVPAALIDAADRAMYAAKDRGRNCACAAEDTVATPNFVRTGTGSKVEVHPDRAPASAIGADYRGRQQIPA